MTNEMITIEAQTRRPGKHFSRKSRLDRWIPAVVYGPKTKPLNLKISFNDAVKYSRHGYENTIFSFKSDESDLNSLQVLRKETQIHPVSREPLHLDFFALDLTQTVTVAVEVKYVGKPQGVKDGGVFNTIKRDVEVECLPTQIPESFELDVTDLKLDENFHVSDLKIPSGIKLVTSESDTLCSVAMVDEVKAAQPSPTDAAAAPAAAEGAATPDAGEKKK